MTNRPTLDDITDNPAALRAQPLEILALLTEEAKVATDRASIAKKAITAELERRYAAAAEVKYRHEGKDTGTVRLTDGGFEIIADRAKRVEWSQDLLLAAVEQIRAAGDDPSEYVDAEFVVQERRYTAWPSHIRAVFEPARTLRPGALTFKLAAKTAEAA